MQIIGFDEINNSKLNDEKNIGIGIDFGTTNSLISVAYSDGNVTVIPDEYGNLLIPSIINFNYFNNAFHIGKYEEVSAKIISIKRILGKNFNQIISSSMLSSLIFGFEVSSANQDDKHVILSYKDYKFTVPYLISKVLLYLKNMAEKYLNHSIKDVVLTVPAHFDDFARGCIMLAAELAGLNILRLISEPTSAGYAYGLYKKKDGCYLVYDLGGGTFDVSVVNIKKSVFQVIATNGDTMLGGDDIDYILLQYFIKKYNIQYSEQLLNIARLAKEYLSNNNVYEIYFDNIRIFITRDIFEKLITSLINRTLNIVDFVLHDIQNKKIDAIILVGGSVRIPLIQKLINHKFPNTNILLDINPNTVVAFGAALQAYNLTSLYSSKQLIIDIVPFTLGLELYGGFVEKIILKNSPIPISVKKEFVTFVDNQEGMQFHVVQGENEDVKHCKSLVKFELSNLPKMVKGKVKVDINFSVDNNGILSISVFEQISMQYKIIEINPILLNR